MHIRGAAFICPKRKKKKKKEIPEKEHKLFLLKQTKIFPFSGRKTASTKTTNITTNTPHGYPANTVLGDPNFRWQGTQQGLSRCDSKRRRKDTASMQRPPHARSGEGGTPMTAGANAPWGPAPHGHALGAVLPPSCPSSHGSVTASPHFRGEETEA